MAAAPPSFSLRPATPADSRRIWEWRTDARDRAGFFSQEKIPFESHERWLAARLASPATRIFMIEDGTGAPLGVVRFDRAAETAEIAIHVDRASRRRGIATDALRIACPRALRELGAAEAVAIVKETNAASRRLFERAGFRDTGPLERAGEAARRYVRAPSPEGPTSA